MDAEPLALVNEAACDLGRKTCPPLSLSEAVVRAIALRLKHAARLDVRDETAIALVSHGLARASRYEQVSGRAVRRVLSRRGWTVTTFVDEVRIQATEELSSCGFGPDQIARALSFSSVVTFRRFVNRKQAIPPKSKSRRMFSAAFVGGKREATG